MTFDVSEVMRALGQLQAGQEEVLRRLGTNDEKINQLFTAVRELQLAAAKRRGGYAMLSAIAMAAATLGGFITKVFFR